MSLLTVFGFELKKWSSNNENLLTDIPPDNKQLKLPFTGNDCVHILGLNWNSERDEFQYIIRFTKEMQYTKWTMLSHISPVCDPLGWVTSVLFRAKTLIQQQRTSATHWDTRDSNVYAFTDLTVVLQNLHYICTTHFSKCGTSLMPMICLFST